MFSSRGVTAGWRRTKLRQLVCGGMKTNGLGCAAVFAHVCCTLLTVIVFSTHRTCDLSLFKNKNVCNCEDVVFFPPLEKVFVSTKIKSSQRLKFSMKFFQFQYFVSCYLK